MIKSFADKTTEKVFNGVYSHRVRMALSPGQMKETQRRLDILNSAQSLDSLETIPSLKAQVVRDAHGKYSIPLFGDQRLAFGWNDGPEDVEIKS